MQRRKKVMKERKINIQTGRQTYRETERRNLQTNYFVCFVAVVVVVVVAAAATAAAVVVVVVVDDDDDVVILCHENQPLPPFSIPSVCRSTLCVAHDSFAC